MCFIDVALGFSDPMVMSFGHRVYNNLLNMYKFHNGFIHQEAEWKLKILTIQKTVFGSKSTKKYRK